MVARPGRGPGAPPRGRTSANTSTSGCSVRSISRRWPPTKPWAPVTRTFTANQPGGGRSAANQPVGGRSAASRPVGRRSAASQPVGGRSAGASSALAVVAPVVLAVGGVRLLERPPPRFVLAVPRHRPRQALRERNLRLPAHGAHLAAVQAVAA